MTPGDKLGADIAALLASINRPKPDWTPSPEDYALAERVMAPYKDAKSVADLFDGPHAAQPWLDALTAAIKRDLFDPNHLAYDDRYGVSLSVQGAHLSYNEGGVTVTSRDGKRHHVYVDAMQPPLFAASVVAHELLHTAQPTTWGNAQAHSDPEFIRGLEALGMIGPPRASLPGPKFEAWFKQHAPQPDDPAFKRAE